MTYIKTGQEDKEVCKKFIEALPPVNQRTFVYVISYLNHLLRFSAENQLTVEKLNAFFTEALTHSSTDLEREIHSASSEPERERIMQSAHVKRSHREGFISLFLM